MKCVNAKDLYMVLAVLIMGMSNWGQPVCADFIFSEPTKVPNINSETSDYHPQISRDGLELYLVSHRGDVEAGHGSNIWVSKRATMSDPWSAPVMLPASINTPGQDTSPCLSADGLKLYFSRGDFTFTASKADLWVAERASRDDPWGVPRRLQELASNDSAELEPYISADGLSLYFMSDRPWGISNSTLTDIFVTTRPSPDALWAEPMKLGSNINTEQYEYTPFISPDGLSLFFSRGYLKAHVYVSRRPTTADPWGPAEFFAPVNSGSAGDVWSWSAGQVEDSLCFAEGDSTVYFCRGSQIGAYDFDIWQVEVTPTVDTDGDGVVTTLDVQTMMEHWGSRKHTLYDVAPLPLGDGVVDAKDLEMFLEYWGTDFRLAAHWPLDEASGTTARDAVSGQWADVTGQAQWQRNGGAIGGALDLDGVDDSVLTSFVLNPAEGPFSVHLWIKGGAPGQVLVSQSGGVDWLWLADSTGVLTSDLAEPPDARTNPTPLISDAVVSDGTWHHVAFVWDGSKRALYVDEVLVAEDSEPVLASAAGPINLGCGADPDVPGTFFSGLIDDVRIYNQVMTP